jgi:hypothetical protein
VGRGGRDLSRWTGGRCVRPANREEGMGCHRRPGRRSGHWPDQNADDQGWLGCQPPLICGGLHRTWEPHPQRRLAGLCGPGEERLSAAGYEIEASKRGDLTVDASCTSGRVFVEALAAGHNQGGVAYYYLPYYLDEFTFRCRNTDHNQADRLWRPRLGQPCSASDPCRNRERS